MLASITPLGERSRGGRHGVTVSYFVVGAVAGGAVVGAVLGAIGSAAFGAVAVDLDVRGWALAAAAAAGVVLDTGVRGARLPSTRRQVNPMWLTEYRRHIYGLGFGFQLGVGFVTIVTSSAVYLCLLAAFLTADPLAGVAIVGTFGAVRGLAVLPARRTDTPAKLADLGDTLRARDAQARRILILAQAVLVFGLVALSTT
jgi:hypothetical protein